MTPTSTRPKFWSDDFDMDLLKIFPELPTLIREPDRLLWTVGHTTFERLNHPNTWNSHGAYLWLRKPNLPRDAHGWFNVEGCVDNAPEVECTWLEWLRDAWSHLYPTVVMPSRQRLPGSPQEAFMAIMYDLRGWQRRDVSEHRKRSLRWVMSCDFILSGIPCQR
jgi:hypothetical protein